MKREIGGRACSSNGSTEGFTLIEVVAALVLLAGALVSITLATARLQRQSRLALDRVAAADVADTLLRRWFESAEGVPINSNGWLPGNPSWSWETKLNRRIDFFGAPADVVNVSILDRRRRGTRVELISVEVVVHASLP